MVERMDGWVEAWDKSVHTAVGGKVYLGVNTLLLCAGHRYSTLERRKNMQLNIITLVPRFDGDLWEAFATIIKMRN